MTYLDQFALGSDGVCQDRVTLTSPGHTLTFSCDASRIPHLILTNSSTMTVAIDTGRKSISEGLQARVNASGKWANLINTMDYKYESIESCQHICASLVRLCKQNVKMSVRAGKRNFRFYSILLSFLCPLHSTLFHILYLGSGCLFIFR